MSPRAFMRALSSSTISVTRSFSQPHLGESPFSCHRQSPALRRTRRRVSGVAVSACTGGGVSIESTLIQQPHAVPESTEPRLPYCEREKYRGRWSEETQRSQGERGEWFCLQSDRKPLHFLRAWRLLCQDGLLGLKCQCLRAEGEAAQAAWRDVVLFDQEIRCGCENDASVSHGELTDNSSRKACGGSDSSTAVGLVALGEFAWDRRARSRIRVKPACKNLAARATSLRTPRPHVAKWRQRNAPTTSIYVYNCMYGTRVRN